MIELSIKDMIDAGAHYGHQTKRWNPKMKPYIYGARSGIYILDLQQTHYLAKEAFQAVEKVVASGKDILFVGTKQQAQGIIEEQANRCRMPYVSHRWLGGMLTNYVTIRKSVDRLLDYKKRRENNDFSGLTKKELLGIDREIEKLEKNLGGIQHMNRVPGAIFVVDPGAEKIAVHEANVLGLPVIAVTDSNCDPDPIDYVIPANDDSLRSINAFASCVADAVLAGLEKRQARAKLDEEDVAKQPKSKPKRVNEGVEGSGKAYVSRADSFAEEGSAENEKIEQFSAQVESAEKTEADASEEA